MKRLCLLLALTLPQAPLLFGEGSFSPAVGAVETWKGALPPRYLVEFEFRRGEQPGLAVVKSGDHALLRQEATTGWRRAEIAVNAESGIYSTWVDGKPVAIEKPHAGRPIDGDALWQSAPSTHDLSGDFTIAVKFRGKGNGTLVSKCAATGRWKPGNKALFIRDGALVYDIGFVGAMRARGKVTDGNWHHAVLVSGGGKARLFVDGVLAAEKSGFTARDAAESVLKIGAAARNFGGNYGGEIGYVRLWQRELPADEIAALGKGEEASTNTPELNWLPGGTAACRVPPTTAPGAAAPGVAAPRAVDHVGAAAGTGATTPRGEAVTDREPTARR